MAFLCGLGFSRVAITPGQQLVGLLSLDCKAPLSSQTLEEKEQLQKHILILLAGRAAEERYLPGITCPTLWPMHIFDYEGPDKARVLVSRLTPGENPGMELESWERQTEKVFADDCIWGAILQIASMLDAAEAVNGEKYLDGRKVNEILTQIIPSEHRAALYEKAFR